MTLRFGVNQAECFRRGICHNSSTATVDVDPATLDTETRCLIADRLDGIDVLALDRGGNKCGHWNSANTIWIPGRVVADGPTLEELLAAVRKNEQERQTS
jgi:hypothetical protein